MLTAIKNRAERFLWDSSLGDADQPTRHLLRFLRFPFALSRDIAGGQLTLRAMSLVYTTLMSLVPLIAFSFSMLKGFGYHREFEPLLEEFLRPLGERGHEITAQIIGFVDNVRGDVLGTVGLLFLIYTAVSMVQKVEDSFNYVWQVQRPRSFARRFSEYLSVLVIGPVFMVFAIGMIGSLASTQLVQWLSGIEPFGSLIVIATKLTPYVVVGAVFTFVYVFVPNTRVRLTAAAVGGLTAGILWATASAVFASFVALAAGRQAIYLGFAIVIVALIWLYLNWLILLLGAQIAFYFQNPQFLRTGRARLQLMNQPRERLALAVMYLIGQDYRRSGGWWDVDALARHFDMPSNALAFIVKRLEEDGLLLVTENEKLVPGRDMDNIRLSEVLAAMRSDNKRRVTPHIEAVDQIVTEVREAIEQSLANRSLKDLVMGARAAPDPGLESTAGADADASETSAEQAKVSGLPVSRTR